MTIPQLKSLILQHNKPELAKRPGMVWQVWDDGEITLQKAGPLLWMRNLHMYLAGVPDKQWPAHWFPNQHGDHGFIFTDEEGAKAVRQAILDEGEGKTEENRTEMNARNRREHPELYA